MTPYIKVSYNIETDEHTVETAIVDGDGIVLYVFSSTSVEIEDEDDGETIEHEVSNAISAETFKMILKKISDYPEFKTPAQMRGQ